MYLLEQPIANHKFVEAKTNEFQQMIELAKGFLAGASAEVALPPVPPPPPNLDFVTPIGVGTA
jgi:hypothetical protein